MLASYPEDFHNHYTILSKISEIGLTTRLITELIKRTINTFRIFIKPKSLLIIVIFASIPYLIDWGSKKIGIKEDVSGIFIIIVTIVLILWSLSSFGIIFKLMITNHRARMGAFSLFFEVYSIEETERMHDFKLTKTVEPFLIALINKFDSSKQFSDINSEKFRKEIGKQPFNVFIENITKTSGGVFNLELYLNSIVHPIFYFIFNEHYIKISEDIAKLDI